MRAAVLHDHGATPQVGEFDEPGAQPGCVLVDVAAAGLHHLDLHKASGTFYTGPPPLPSVVGTDGVGRLEDGRRVFFDQCVPPYGSMAERTLVPEDVLLLVADDVADEVAAALGAAGSIAVQAARLLGAGRVIAADRGSDRLHRMVGPDVTVEVESGRLADVLRDAAPDGVDLTIDMLWGEPALAAMEVANRFARHVEVGNMAGPDLTLAAPLIRSASLDIRGFSVAHPPPDVKRDAYLRLTGHAARGEISVDLDARPLDDVGAAWERQRRAEGGPKTVLIP